MRALGAGVTKKSAAACGLALLCACLAPSRYHLEHAHTLAAQGDHRAAAAYFQSALRGLSAGSERDRIEANLRASAWAWARAEAAGIPPLSGQAQLDPMLQAMESVRSAVLAGYPKGGARLPADAEAELATLLDPQVRTAAAQVEDWGSQHRFVPAVRVAERLAAILPQHTPAREQVLELRRRAAARHAELADQARHPLVRAFHTCLAASFDGTKYAGRCRDLAAAVPAGVRPPVAHAGQPVMKATHPRCSALGDAIVYRLRGFAGTRAVAVELARCERHTESETLREQFTYPDQETAIAWVEEPYYDTKLPAKCEERACERYDPLGMCVQAAQVDIEACGTPERVLRTRKTPVRSVRMVPRRSVREVEVRRDTLLVRGTVRLPSGKTLPLDTTQVVEEREFWSPHESQRFTSAPGDPAPQVVNALWRQITAAVEADAKVESEADRVVLERVLDRAAEAGREEIFLTHIGQATSSSRFAAAATEHFQRYGATLAEAQKLRSGQALPLGANAVRAAALSAPQISPRLKALAPVKSAEPKFGARRLLGDGTDIGFVTAQSPLAEGESATGVRFSLRAGDERQGALIRVRGDTPNLGGDTRGFGIDFAIRIAGASGAGRGLSFGVGYDELRNLSGARYTNLSLPLAYYWGFTPWLVADLELRLNMLAAKDWVRSNRRDPHFYSPLSLGLTWVSTHFYVEGRTARYLGQKHVRDGDYFYIYSAAVGVRL